VPVSTFADYLARALHLLALCLAPQWLSPDPAPVTNAQGLLAGFALLGLLVAAARFRKALGGKLAAYAAAAVFATVAVALTAALLFQGERGPLGRAVPYLAPLWWSTLALAAAATAQGLLLERVRARAALVAAGLVLAFGAVVVLRAQPLLGSPEQMWRRAADLEPGHERAQLQVAAELLPRRDFAQILSGADRCVAERGNSCTCRGLRAWSKLRLGARDEGLAEAHAAASLCGDHPLVRASYAHGLSLAGFHQQALSEVQLAWPLLEGWGVERRLFELELYFAQALALGGSGQHTAALAAAQRAVDIAGGRDARLLAAAIAIGSGELDVAAEYVEAILRSDRTDEDAVYNRALIADRRGDYNRAREGYLATLKLSPAYAAARYNVAVLTWHRGVRDEARHHVQLFLRHYPGDPGIAALLEMVSAEGSVPPTLKLPSPPSSAPPATSASAPPQPPSASPPEPSGSSPQE